MEDLIRAVKNARGMHAYDAKVKNECAQRDLVLLRSHLALVPRDVAVSIQLVR